jgi:hypothetical protein
MKSNGPVSVLVVFLLSVLVAVVLGSVIQTQYNLAALSGIGAEVGPVRLSTTLRDVFSGFVPTYGGYVVLPALLVAFGVAEWISRRFLPDFRLPLYVLAGFAALIAAIPLVNWLSPVALLVGATRDRGCLFWMAAAGAAAGLVFAWMTRDRLRPARPAADPARASVAAG